jgi:hypothetical protein
MGQRRKENVGGSNRVEVEGFLPKRLLACVAFDGQEVCSTAINKVLEEMEGKR